MSSLPLPPPPAPNTVLPARKVTTINGFRELRKDLTQVFAKVDKGCDVEIIKLGFDRKEICRYKLVKVVDTLPE